MSCEKCGQDAPVKYVEFHQNVGLLVMRFSTSAEGYYCKSCIHATYWTMQMVNLTCGWWGVISMIITPIFIMINTIRYIPALFMASEHPGPRVRAKPKKKAVRRRQVVEDEDVLDETDVVDDSPEETPRPRRRRV